jgi:trigger factor
MQCTEIKSEGLTRVYSVTVAAAVLAEKLDAKIKEAQPQIRLKGFRPGKVPAAHIKRLYGRSMMGEVMEAAVNEGTQKVLDDNKLRPASQPDVHLEADANKVADGEEDLKFHFHVEIMPEFTPVDVTTLEVERPVAEVAEAELDEALGKIAEGNQQYEAKKATAKAKDGDAVVIDFVGKIDGTPFEGGAAEEATVVIGQGRFIPGFEEQLVGVKKDDETVLNVSFPDDYHAEALKGKAATFDVKVREVKGPKTATIDDDFAKGLGLEDLAALKAAVSEQIAGQYKMASRAKAKRKLLDALDTAHDFDLPPGMVEAEFNQIWAQVEQEKNNGTLADEDKDKSEDDLKAEYRTIAERRVRLGLVLAEIGRTAGVTVSDQEVSQAIVREARNYPGQEQMVLDFYRKNPNAAAQVRAPLFEEKVVDYILERAKVTDKTVTKEELLAEDEA